MAAVSGSDVACRLRLAHATGISPRPSRTEKNDESGIRRARAIQGAQKDSETPLIFFPFAVVYARRAGLY